MRTSSLTLAAALSSISFTVHAQSMADALNNACTVTWIGLDFSEARFVPSIDFAEVEGNTRAALLKWNNLMEQEPDKFNMGKALDITRCVTNTSFVKDLNEAVTAEKLLAREPYTLDKAKIPGMVNAYKTTGDGVGVVLIVSTFDKTQGIADYYVTFFNMKTHDLLYTEMLTETPLGFGMRNYWAHSVYTLLKTIEHAKARDWRGQFK